MGVYLKRNVDRVFVILGTKCNLNCKYCMQHEITNKQIFNEINPEIYDFLTEIAYENKDKEILITFYGGEPLLYFDNIKEIVNVLNAKNGVCFRYGIITNAKLLTDEMVAFFNDNNIGVAVSYDGKNVDYTRGFDAFANPDIRQRVLALNGLSLTGVISAKNYPLDILNAMQEISNEYYQLHGYHLQVNLDELLDVGIADNALWNFDYDRVKREISQIVDEVDQYVKGKAYDFNNSVKVFYVNSLISAYATGEANRDKFGQFCYCGNGYSVLNIDLKGNLYPCHNTGLVVGNIKSDYFEYLNAVMKHDTTNLHGEECKKCFAFNICKGGCKLVKDKQKNTCKLMKALYEPIIKYIKSFNEGDNIANNSL